MSRHVVVHQFDPSRHVAGGIEGFIRDFVSQAPEGEEVALVGVSSRSADSALGRWADVELGGRRVRFMPVARFTAGDQRRRVPHALRLALGLARHRPDLDDAVIHTHRTDVAAAVAFLYPAARRVAFIQTDEAEAQRHKTETFWRFLPGVHGRLERYAVRRSERTIVMSSRAAARLRSASDRVVVGAQWFDPTAFNARGRLDRGVFTVGWIGRLEPSKDPLRAVATLAALRAREVEFRAWLAGTGTLEREVRAAVDAAGLAGVVRMEGLLSPHELGERLRSTHAALVTSRWEGFPRAAVEILACGVPVVTTAVGEMPALVQDGRTGFVAENGRPDGLAELLDRVRALIPPGESVAASVGAYDSRVAIPRLYAEIGERG